MLPDYERKVLGILHNYTSQRSRMPNIHELEIKTGLSKQRIKEALLLLEKESYIVWEDKSSLERILITEGWERETDTPKQSTVKPNSKYWTEY
ncbi:hypothetical protein QPK24_15690 [Paenibacillus polygoni]|uniref:Uncharacterized protein n=1 Tax=Paenibacillus polygoni TaxID=3050112 RepID=A0ABY8WZL9_9BACL|nr:hypothetical protein [Paenibacillus polygoni]WIV17849.1 hypothetical protein QPK24_15690 [Paenibacillus polygoni]